MPNFKAKFAVLVHDWPEFHWDLMLEKQASLRTFRLSHPPDQPGAVVAEPLADHRKVYLGYEGEVSGNRGTVTRWDSGTYELVSDTDLRIEIRLEGERLTGTAVLSREADEDDWTFALTSAS
ncbi:ATP-dependent DNA ligase [Symmachiella macrocystis]|uniref:ATP-dependent DNA ligase n=1 Tax=Symmachiella macrocystis TaxID=2527985 RepID=A0A5C6BQ62_9PLAN|nr:DNA polymerase ligase N-terminal domain-containing protein [Symmachiella macrocystis]TWU14370.1 ATP-dependent DNA ligase [Symmachiella macrocystis]